MRGESILMRRSKKRLRNFKNERRKKMREIKLGLVAGQRKLPLAVDGFVLNELQPGEDMYHIHKAVQKSLEDKLGKYIHITEYGPSIDGVQEDVAHYACDAKLILYITGPAYVAMDVVVFCAANGVSLTAYHYDDSTGSYVPQPLL